MEVMTLDDAVRVARIFEADDVISVPARACRVLAKAIDNLEQQIVDLKLAAKKAAPLDGDSK